MQRSGGILADEPPLGETAPTFNAGSARAAGSWAVSSIVPPIVPSIVSSDGSSDGSSDCSSDGS